MAISAPFAFSGSPIAWNGIPILPGGQDPFGADTLAGHYAWHKADLLITLCDPFMMTMAPLKGLHVAHWVPVDSERLGKADREKLTESGGMIVAMSRFGQARLTDAGFDAAYVPHAVDTGVFKPPADPGGVRAEMGLDGGAFVVGINAVNKDGPRKNLDGQLAAFAQFHARHPEARLLVHALIEPRSGVNLRAVAEDLGIRDAVFFPDQYNYACGMIPDEGMASWYGVLDVLLQGTEGEGFGLPVLEAQSCGTPVICTDFSALSELCHAGWKVPAGEKHWVGGHDSWWYRPHIADLDKALEKAWRAREDGRMPALAAKGRRFALRYDADKVFKECWLPVLAELERTRRRILEAPARAAVERIPAGEGKRDLLVIVPSRGRPENVKRLAAAVAETCTARTDLVFGFDEDDPALEANIAAAEAGQASWRKGPRKTLTAWTNQLALGAWTSDYPSTPVDGYKALASLGDDHIPRTHGWDDALLAALDSTGGGFAYPNDGVRDDVPEAVVISSEIVQALGWMANPALSHFWIDNTWADLGKAAGCLTYCPDVMVEHAHPAVDPAAKADATYTEATARVPADEAAYRIWRAERMKADVATVTAALAPVTELSPLMVEYHSRLSQDSDIRDHMPFLFDAVAGYVKPTVIELGVRSGNSTSALLAGAEQAGGCVWSADVNAPQVPDWWHRLPCWQFTQGDDTGSRVRSFLPPACDVLFIDTSHAHLHTLEELTEYAPRVRPGGVILMHDTEYDPHPDEVGGVPQPHWPVAVALDEYFGKDGWENRPGCNGLGVIRIPGKAG